VTIFLMNEQLSQLQFTWWKDGAETNVAWFCSALNN